MLGGPFKTKLYVFFSFPSNLQDSLSFLFFFLNHFIHFIMPEDEGQDATDVDQPEAVGCFTAFLINMP